MKIASVETGSRLVVTSSSVTIPFSGSYGKPPNVSAMSHGENINIFLSNITTKNFTINTSNKATFTVHYTVFSGE